MGDERWDEATDPKHFGKRDDCQSNSHNSEILGDEEPGEDDRRDEGGAALTDKTKYLPKKTFNGGAP